MTLAVQQLSPPPWQAPRQETILLIDRSAQDANLVRRALPSYSVVTVTDGDAAVRAAETSLPDLILLDIEATNPGGFEVCRRLKSHAATRHVPIMLMTAAPDITSERQGLELGAVDIISKPLHVPLLQARIRNHLDLCAFRVAAASAEALPAAQPQRPVAESAMTMGQLAAFREREPSKHISRTMRYVELLLRSLEKQFAGDEPPFDRELIYHVVALHDIGKIGIRPEILNKPGPLSAEEFEEIKRHTAVGAKLIRQLEAVLGQSGFLLMARDIVEYHHERFDGSGYPHGLIGDEIPLIARVMAVADVYDALVSSRPYKAACSHHEAVQAILVGDGKTRPEQFCPRVLLAFIEVKSQFEVVSNRYLDD